ncbi:MAG: acyltransferase [Lachnospiraceae bacterium]|nr:acyltransferase [Lachnospiraceae bacterium]
MNGTIIGLQIFPILLAVLGIFSIKKAKKGEFSEEYLNLDQSKMIQAIACICIILHHLTQQVTGYGVVGKGPVTLLNYIGFLFTAIFFFFSGFGLITSIYGKPDYMKTFLKKRLPTVLIPFWIINIFGVLLNVIFYGIHYNRKEIFDNIFGITLINGNGWFIVEIVLLYLLFYALFTLIKNKDVALFLLSIATILIIVYCFYNGHDPEGDKHWFKGEWWYNSTITFIFGMYYARFRNAFDKFFKKHYRGLLIICSILLFFAIIASIYVQKRFGYYIEDPYFGRRSSLITLIVQSVSCIIYTSFVLLLSLKLTLGNPVLKYLSKISMELFLIHGYFIHRIFGDIKLNDILRFTLVLVCSIITTAILAPAISFVVDGIIYILNKKRLTNDTLENEIAEKIRAKRIKILNRIAAASIIVICAFILYVTLGRHLVAQREFNEEYAALKEANIGDRVLFGRFETIISKPGKERLEWIVIGKDGDKIKLLASQGIAGSYYHQKHEDITWKKCDLREYLNSTYFTDMFSKYEWSCVCDNADVFTLLTVDELYELYPNAEDRKLIVTDYAQATGTNANRISKLHQWDMKGYDSSWWWLKGSNKEGEITAPIVEIDGSIYENKKYVNKPGGAIRPVLYLTFGD